MDRGHSKMLLNLTDVPYMDDRARADAAHGYVTARRGDADPQALLPAPRIRKFLEATNLPLSA